MQIFISAWRVARTAGFPAMDQLFLELIRKQFCCHGKRKCDWHDTPEAAHAMANIGANQLGFYGPSEAKTSNHSNGGIA